METFSNFNILLVLNLHTEVSLSILNYDYVEFPHTVIDLLPLRIIVKEVVDNLVIDNKNLKCVLSLDAYEDNSGAIVVSTSPRMTLT